MGDRLDQLQGAERQLAEEVKILGRSAYYETQAWGNEELQPFINSIVKISTSLSPAHLLDLILSIEESAGRIRKNKWEARTLDIDIISYGSVVLESKRLTIPHPLMQERKFVLVPLQEVEAGWKHPRLLRSIEELITACPDQTTINKIELSH